MHPGWISSILFRTGLFVDSIEVAYRNIYTQEIQYSPQIGGAGGGLISPFELAMGEHITSFSGIFSRYVLQIEIIKHTNGGDTTYDPVQ